MSAPGKIVVGKLEREGLHTGNQEAQAELRTAKPGEHPVHNLITFSYPHWPKPLPMSGPAMPQRVPTYNQAQPTSPSCLLHGSSPLDHRSSASCDPL